MDELRRMAGRRVSPRGEASSSRSELTDGADSQVSHDKRSAMGGLCGAPLLERRLIPRATIAAEARSWIGTPYRHQASAKDAGCDCLGLVRGVWRALYGEEPETTPAYTPDWSEHGAERLYHAARRHLLPISIDESRRGDVLLFRMAPGAAMKHCAILSDSGLIVHAYWGRAVVESRLSPWWRVRIGAAFSFPRVEPWLG